MIHPETDKRSNSDILPGAGYHSGAWLESGEHAADNVGTLLTSNFGVPRQNTPQEAEFLSSPTPAYPGDSPLRCVPSDQRSDGMLRAVSSSKVVLGSARKKGSPISETSCTCRHMSHILSC
jgi:hypothetical protein